MFESCKNLTIIDVESFNTSLVTDMEYIFYECREVKELNISKFETSLVTNI